jgi:TolB-like protein
MTRVIRRKSVKILLSIMLIMLLALPMSHAADQPAITHPSGDSKIRMAVLYFDNESITDRKALDPFRKGIADTLIDSLNRTGKFQIVERTRMESMMSELKLSLSGMVDASTAQRLGKILGVQMLLMGSFTAIGEMIRIDARVIQAETGLVLKAEEVSGQTSDFMSLEEALVLKIALDLDAKMTAEEKARLYSGKKISFPALMEYSRGLGYMDSGQFAEAARAFEKALALAPGYKEAGEKLQEVYRKAGGQYAVKEQEQRETYRLAIFPLEDLSPGGNTKGLGEDIAANITDALTKTKNVQVIERVQIEKIIREAVLNKSGSSNPNAMLQAGKLLGANCLMLGSIQRFRDQVSVQLRMVRTETGEILSTVKISGKFAELPAMKAYLVQQTLSFFKNP